MSSLRDPNPATTTTISVRPPSHQEPFCHTFDLTKRLTPSSSSSLPVNHIPISPLTDNPFPTVLTSLTRILNTSPPNIPHRLILPILLSPALYHPSSCDPTILLPFLHSLRALLRTNSSRLTAMLSIPLSLYPRTTGLTRWIEHLNDGVLELSPFPYTVDLSQLPSSLSSSNSSSNDNSSTAKEPRSGGGGGGGSTKTEEKAQGMVRIHKLPVISERGQAAGGGDDLAFALGRRRFVIRPFHLPPIEGDQDAQRGDMGGGGVGKLDIEF